MTLAGAPSPGTGSNGAGCSRTELVSKPCASSRYDHVSGMHRPARREVGGDGLRAPNRGRRAPADDGEHRAGPQGPTTRSTSSRSSPGAARSTTPISTARGELVGSDRAQVGDEIVGAHFEPARRSRRRPPRARLDSVRVEPGLAERGQQVAGPALGDEHAPVDVAQRFDDTVGPFGPGCGGGQSGRLGVRACRMTGRGLERLDVPAEHAYRVDDRAREGDDLLHEERVVPTEELGQQALDDHAAALLGRGGDRELESRGLLGLVGHRLDVVGRRGGA